MRDGMRRGHWCGKFWGTWTALSALGLVACSGSYELGHEAGGAAGAGATSGGGSAGKGGSGGKSGARATGGSGGAAQGRGGNQGSGAAVNEAGGSPGDVEMGGEPGELTAGSGGTGTAGSGPTNAAISLIRTDLTKLDLLFVIDGSLGMAEKQARLAKSMPLLVGRLTNPWCMDGSTRLGSADAQGNCAQGTLESPPLRDVHIGVISSNLGDHGSGDVCSQAQAQLDGGGASYFDDHAQLLPTVRNDLGTQDFLAWGGSSSDAAQLVTDTASQIAAVDERGCGYEASLEAWYRFLIDPSPVATMTNDGQLSERGAVNQVVLDERVAFLRSDSALMIVMLTDENDCSILDENGSQGWLVGYKGGPGKDDWRMPRASSACAVDPNDLCCRPCGGGAVPAGCPADGDDPVCSQFTPLSVNEDSMNLRCFEQKQRFGVDLLYPVSRYSDALSLPFIAPRLDGAMVPNPLFSPGPGGKAPRSPSLVYLAGIVGVPWQDLALANTLATDQPLQFSRSSDLVAANRWDVILGDPDGLVPPTDPLMIESIDPRPTGALNPILNVPIAGPDATTRANPINGHEQNVLPARDDLQFACIYPREPVLSPSDCTQNPDLCDCNADEFSKNSPLCDGGSATTDGSQTYGKAYPAVRELQVLKAFGENAVVTSICPKSTSTDDPTSDLGYGYNPAVRAIGDVLTEAFSPKCLPKPLQLGAPGQTAARLFEARPDDQDCSCDSSQGRLELDATAQTYVPAMQRQLQNTGADPNQCFCEIAQLDGDELSSCQNDGRTASDIYGFCYIDPAQNLGSASLVAACAESQRQRIRFVGGDLPAPDATTLIVLPFDPSGN